jgi:hypothetical protein
MRFSQQCREFWTIFISCFTRHRRLSENLFNFGSVRSG